MINSADKSAEPPTNLQKSKIPGKAGVSEVKPIPYYFAPL